MPDVPESQQPRETGIPAPVEDVAEVPVPAPEAFTSPVEEIPADDVELDPTEAAIAAALAGKERDAAVSRRCLIVDDSRVVRKLSRKIAEQLGFRVAEAENGEEALARCRTSMPDLVITDWQMPVLSGPEFVAQFRQIPGSNRAKVIFCTSKGEATDIHEGISAGADDYIVKPFDEAKLKAKLQRLVMAG